ncbi:MAG: zinc ABC transporter substrate-binding protein, partial [Actinomycetia bacterium]|nr:zinc ABC transporter substrate-binding protein [Actinomycetes bacterium]
MRRRRPWSVARGIAIVGVAVLVAACSLAGGADRAQRPVVLTTFTVLADIAANVAGEHLTVESITKPGAEIHGYEPTPGDIKKAARADLILDNGLNLEAWFAQFVDGLDVPHVVVSDGVQPLNITEDAYAGIPNPHAWMSPLNVQIYADNMASAFADLDPTHAQDYRANAAAYSTQLQEVHDDLV